MIDKARDTTAVILTQLDRAPEIGSTLELPNGNNVLVRHVVSGRDDVVGVVIAAPV